MIPSCYFVINCSFNSSRERRRWIKGVQEVMVGRGLWEGDWEDRDFWISSLAGQGYPELNACNK